MEADLRERVKKGVLSDIDLSAALTDSQIADVIDKWIIKETKDYYCPLKEKVDLKRTLFNSLRRLDILTEYLEDEEVTEIMINGKDNIFLEKNGRIIRAEKSFESEEKLRSVIQQIVADCNRRVNESSPIVDARLKDGSRVNIVINPISLDGSVVTIRKFPKEVINIKKLIELGSITAPVAKILEAFVKAGLNIFVSGGTGSGKTTFLNCLSDFIPKNQRIITIEDAAELQIKGVPNLVRLEARSANVEGENEVTIRNLLKTSLRMRPDRIIVGEVRDDAAIDMLSAMNTGHDGSLSTGHANSAEDMIVRLETMVLMGMDLPLEAVRRQIASAIDVVVHLGRLRDATRRVLAIKEVVGMKDGNVCMSTLFEFKEEGEINGRISGNLRKINDLMNVDKLKNLGQIELYREGLRELSTYQAVGVTGAA